MQKKSENAHPESSPDRPRARTDRICYSAVRGYLSGWDKTGRAMAGKATTERRQSGKRVAISLVAYLRAQEEMINRVYHDQFER